MEPWLWLKSRGSGPKRDLDALLTKVRITEDLSLGPRDDFAMIEALLVEPGDGEYPVSQQVVVCKTGRGSASAVPGLRHPKIHEIASRIGLAQPRIKTWEGSTWALIT